MDFSIHREKFKERSTARLMKEYNGYNAEYKKLAREEFKKRGVKGRPYTERKQSSQEDNNEFGFPKFKTGFGHW